MGKKLFEVYLEATAYAVADSEEEAEQIVKTIDIDFFSYQTFLANRVDNKWANSIPYGSEDGKTCGKILEEMKRQAAQEEFFNKHQLKLFEEVQG